MRTNLRSTENPAELGEMSRRGLLLGALGVGSLAVAGCGGPQEVTSMYSDAFYVAHRGGGRDWPEMTVYAYQKASKLPNLTAMEVSVRRSRDGVLVCSHDATTGRVCDKDLEIARTDWKDLAGLMVLPKETLDPAQPPRQLARFDAVLASWPAGVTMWVEPKSDDAVDLLFHRLSRFPDLDVVWKRPINAPGYDKAKLQGWGTFGYVLEGAQQTAYLDEVAPTRWMDQIGVQVTASDERIREIVAKGGAYGKKTVVWALSTTQERDRVLRLGARGLMCSNIRDLMAAPLPQ